MKFPKYIKLVSVFIATLCLFSGLSVANSSSGDLILKKGDVISQRDEDGSWHTIKVLEVDKWPDGTFTAHCLTYKPLLEKPTLAQVNKLDIFAYHAPIDAASFYSGWDLIGNSLPQQSEFVGFIEYLKLTDFRRYAEVTNQDINTLVSEANRNYKLAIELGENGKHQEAIELYSKAIDLFLLFYEAIDNRAFTYMDLGQFENALSGFQLSLQVNPEGLAAFFSVGECLLKLGKYEESIKVFKEGLVKFPEKKALFEEFYKKAEAAKKHG